MSDQNVSQASFDLSGKVALVTGGSRGLGRAMALGFARAGADIAIASRKQDACDVAASEVEALGRQALGLACHVGEWDALEPMVDAVYERFGRIDVLVNNAGMSPIAESSSVRPMLWSRIKVLFMAMVLVIFLIPLS
jgi:NAD(P)-dependent dehydrogenase (short-subunit alcohol dehydrogenase family)